MSTYKEYMARAEELHREAQELSERVDAEVSRLNHEIWDAEHKAAIAMAEERGLKIGQTVIIPHGRHPRTGLILEINMSSDGPYIKYRTIKKEGRPGSVFTLGNERWLWVKVVKDVDEAHIDSEPGW